MSQNNPFDNNLYKCAACNVIFTRCELEFYEYNGDDDYEAYCESCNNKKITKEKKEREKLDEEYAFYMERIVVNTEKDFGHKYCHVNNYDAMFEEFEYAGGSSYCPKANHDAQNILEEIQRSFISDIAAGNFDGCPEKMKEIATKIKNKQ